MQIILYLGYMNEIMKKKSVSTKVFVLIFVWIAVCLSILYLLAEYSSLKGVRGINPNKFPVEGNINFIEDKFNLLFFVHPKCPCTLASFNELKKITSRISKPYVTKVIFSIPEGFSNDWAKESRLYKNASFLGEKNLVLDKDEFNSKLFNIKTSGHLLIYNSKRELIYSGGVTGSRAHEGDNLYSDNALKAIETNSSQEGEVFGCPVAID